MLNLLSLSGPEEGSCSITPYGINSLSKYLSSPNATLEDELDLSRNNIGIEGGLSLAEALSDNSVLNVLDIDRSVSPGTAEWIMSADGWIIFFEYLKRSDLRRLDLRGNTIADGNIAPMVDALIAMESLTDLNLQDTRITSSGWIDFFKLGGLSKLAKLDIMGDYNLNDEVMIALAKALVGNSSLKDVSIGIGSLDSVTHGGGWAALSNTLCDKSCIESICNSNHTLTMSNISLLSLFGVPDSIIPLLHLNTGKNKADVAREKIFRYY